MNDMNLFDKFILVVSLGLMENHKRLPNIIQKETYTQLLTDKGRFGFSPIKTKHSIPVRNSFKPFSSAIVRESKPLPSKEDLVRMSSKI